MKTEPDINELKMALEYNPESGIFIWKQNRGGSALVGAVAGATNFRGYRSVFRLGVHLLLHRVAWAFVYGNWPQGHIDHVNQVKTDNRISNLRIATQRQNACNRGKSKNNTSGYKGVYIYGKKFTARINVRRKCVHLGYFADAQSASEAYVNAAKKYHGEFWSK